MMELSAIYANLNCTDLHRSSRWFSALFERDADAMPMPGLAEWHHSRRSGFQLFENPDAAGDGTLTLIVKDVRSEHARLSRIGPGRVELGDHSMIVRLRDPDGNMIVLAEGLES